MDIQIPKTSECFDNDFSPAESKAVIKTYDKW
jgi:hypothetical protein